MLRLFAKRYGLFKLSIPFFILYFSLFYPTLARPEENQYLDELLKKAEEIKLYNDRYWEILLHYKSTTSGLKSLIDDPNFFLSPYGKENPEVELKATLMAFFKSTKKDDDHPKCRFIARYEWLKEKLNIDGRVFSDISCNDFHNILNNVQPKFAVLVFPAFYMNNPSSLFGHTLMRIDSSYQSKLLSHAVNYAAHVEDAGILYPIKGIFGFYKGYFKVFPYYDKIKEYNDTEQRDMWEYSLNLSEEEVRKMFLHLWELKDIYSYYFFFDENCSYNLLFLLEAARPSLNLTDSFGPWVIPVDTIRAVKNSGVVRNMEFRPAMSTRIRYIASLLDEGSQIKAIKIAEDKLDPDSIEIIDKEKRVNILNLATETIQYRYNSKVLNKDEYLKLFLSTLKERSKLGKSDDDPYNIPAPSPPENGHFSNRFSLGFGIKEGDLFGEFKYRPAYHSLTDADDGFLEGSQIVFLDTGVRYSEGKIRLWNLDLIDITSLSPRDHFFKPLSFKIKTGLTSKMLRDEDVHLVYQLNPGLGLSYKNRFSGLSYLLAEADLNLSGELEDNYSLGIGILAGTIKKITDFWKLNLQAEALFFGFGEKFQEYKASVVQGFRLSQNNSLDLSYSWNNIFHNDQYEAKLNWNYYF